MFDKNGFYLNAIKYGLQNLYNGKKEKIDAYKLLNKTKVNIHQIKQIKIVEIIRFGFSRNFE